MPELPEAEAQRRLLERCVVGHRITSVNALEQGGGARDGAFDDKVMGEGLEPAALEGLVGGRVTAAKRLGKQVWLELDDGARAVLVHLGMTGSLVVRGQPAPKYKSFAVDEASWPPKYTKLELALSGGGRLAYCDPRRFGRIKLRGADALTTAPLSELAPDALTPPDAEAMGELLAKKEAPIKAVLLDQSAVCCGIGNWVADEVLYQSRVHPATVASRLSAAQVAGLRAAIVSVCTAACEANADSEAFPADWLFHHRWAKQTSGSVASPLGRICFDTIGGRTTAFLPDVQKKTEPAAAAKAKPAAKASSKPAAKKAAGKAPKPAAKKKRSAAAAQTPSQKPAAKRAKSAARRTSPRTSKHF